MYNMPYSEHLLHQVPQQLPRSQHFYIEPTRTERRLNFFIFSAAIFRTTRANSSPRCCQVSFSFAHSLLLDSFFMQLQQLSVSSFYLMVFNFLASLASIFLPNCVCVSCDSHPTFGAKFRHKFCDFNASIYDTYYILDINSRLLSFVFGSHNIKETKTQ